MALCGVLWVFAAGRADAAAISVNTVAGLQAAVASGTAGDVITLNPQAVGGAVYPPSAPLIVSRNLTIQAPAGAADRYTLNGGAVVDAVTGQNDLIRVSPGVTLTVVGITLASTDSFSSIADVSGTLSLDRVTVSGGLLNGITVEGGGTLNALNTTIADNGFGVVLNAAGTANFRSTTVAANALGAIFNSGGSNVSLVNTIVDSATGADCAAPVQSATNSRGSDSPTTCGAGIAVGPNLLGTQTTNNGGPTNTRRLLPGSLARDAGTLAANCPAVDQRGAPRSVAPCDIGAYEADRTNPVLAQPPNVPQAGAITATGATTPVTYTLPTATDADGFLATVTPVVCTPASGSLFQSGTGGANQVTTVTCVASNVDGLTDTKTFTVTVGPQPTVPPVVTVPANQVIEATGPSGAAFSFPVTASNGGSTPVCTSLPTVGLTSGSTFPIGVTTVACSSTNAFGTGNASFTITVQDTTGPTITVPPAQTVEATGPAGAVVNYAAPTATDVVSGTRPVSCTPISGSQFPLGATTITCTSSDTFNNTSQATFTMTVRVTLVVTPPADLSVEATGPNGAVVSYPPATALDSVDGSVPAACSPPSGSTFPLGTSTVSCSATNSTGVTQAASFRVTVVDTTPPVVTVPQNLVLSTSRGARVVGVFSASALDSVAPVNPAVSCIPGSGTAFPLGVTTVTCRAADAAGNSATRSFTVTVREAPAAYAICFPEGKIDGRGSETAAAAWAALSAGFKRDFCGPTPGLPADAAGDLMVSYNGGWATGFTGSRQGLVAAACRSNAFSSSDGPYTAAELSDLRGPAGTLTHILSDATATCAQQTSSGALRLSPPFMPPGTSFPASADTAAPVMSFPVAATAVAPVVNVTGAGCQTVPRTLSFTKEMVDGLFDGAITAWSDVRLRDANANGVADGTGADQQLPPVNPTLADCTGTITRVVRQDDAPSTQVLKSYLAKVDPLTPGCDRTASFTWSALRGAARNTGWPGGPTPVALTTGVGVPASTNPNCSPVVSSTAPGGPALRAIIDQLGFSGIGYLDLPDAGQGAHLILPQIRNATDTNYATPNVATRANCHLANVSAPAGTPDGAAGLDATDTWASDQDVNNRSDITLQGPGFPICGLTFALLYTNLGTSPRPGVNPIASLNAPQRQTLLSFFSYALSSGGQDAVTTANYQRLPVALATQVRSAVQANY